MSKLAVTLLALYFINASFGASYERLNLSQQLVYLEPEVGQNDADVRYWVRGTGSHLRLTSNSIQAQPRLGLMVSLPFATGNPVSVPLEPVPSRINRYQGPEANWKVTCATGVMGDTLDRRVG